MRVVKWLLSIGFSDNADRTGEVEVEDDATPEDVEAAVREDAFNFIELSWEESL